MSKKKTPALTAIDRQLDAFEAKNEEIATLSREAEEIRTRIRSGLVEIVVVFIDMVGSTKYKVEHQADPETWILRVRQFDVLIAEYVAAASGRVVKYIGDEVMAAFEGADAVDNAMSLVSRVGSIQEKLGRVTGAPTLIKIAMDRGPVYLLELPGHTELDPQGTPIDRCARIAKYAQAGTVLASYDIVSTAPAAYHWEKVGQLPMKGLGDVLVFQLGKDRTVTVEDVVELPVKKLDQLNEELAQALVQIQTDALDNKKLREMNVALQDELRAANVTPSAENVVTEKADEGDNKVSRWQEIEDGIAELKKVIRGVKGPDHQYARFLFLGWRNEVEEYNKYEGRTFDELIQSDLVESDDNRFWHLNQKQPRNRRAMDLMQALDDLLRAYENDFGLREDDLFEYTLNNGDTWSEILKLEVVY